MFNFELAENEKLLEFYRQTESTLFYPVIIIFVLIYFPWYFLIKYELLADNLGLLFFWTVLVLLYGINRLVLWLLNVYLVTDKRVIVISYKNLFNKKVSEAVVKHIVNVSFTRQGVLETMFDHGSVDIQITGVKDSLVLSKIAHPHKVKDFIQASFTIL